MLLLRERLTPPDEGAALEVEDEEDGISISEARATSGDEEGGARGGSTAERCETPPEGEGEAVTGEERGCEGETGEGAGDGDKIADEVEEEEAEGDEGGANDEDDDDEKGVDGGVHAAVSEEEKDGEETSAGAGEDTGDTAETDARVG